MESHDVRSKILAEHTRHVNSSEWVNSHKEAVLSWYTVKYGSSPMEIILESLSFAELEAVTPIFDIQSFKPFRARCLKCGLVFESVFQHSLQASPNGCPKCSAGSTVFERRLASIIESHSKGVIPHYLKSVKSSFLQGQELDLFIPNNPSACPPSSKPRTFIYPSGGIASEINGAYSHNSAINPCIPSSHDSFI